MGHVTAISIIQYDWSNAQKPTAFELLEDLDLHLCVCEHDSSPCLLSPGMCQQASAVSRELDHSLNHLHKIILSLFYQNLTFFLHKIAFLWIDISFYFSLIDGCILGIAMTCVDPERGLKPDLNFKHRMGSTRISKSTDFRPTRWGSEAFLAKRVDI